MSYHFVVFCHTIHNVSFQNSCMREGTSHELTSYLLAIVLAFSALCHRNIFVLVGSFNFGILSYSEGGSATFCLYIIAINF